MSRITVEVTDNEIDRIMVKELKYLLELVKKEPKEWEKDMAKSVKTVLAVYDVG